MNVFEHCRWVFLIICFSWVTGLWSSPFVFAQQNINNIEQRVEALEVYLEQFQPNIVKFADQMQKSIAEYTGDLERSLAQYSQSLQKDLNDQLNQINNRSIMLDPYTRSFQKIETNVGTFLIAVKEVDVLEQGVALVLNVGNPNYADYKDLSFRLTWGASPPRGNDQAAYKAWRQSLTETEVSFEHKLEKGMWHAFRIAFGVGSLAEIAHIECQLDVRSIELMTP